MARRNHRKAIAILCLASIALLAGSCRTAPKPSPTKPIESPLLRFGQDRFLAGDFNAAALAFGDLIMITSDPDIQNEALYWRALSYIKLTRFQQAETDLLMVVDRTKENKLKANAFRALGDALLAQAKFKLAADILTKALTRHPNDVPRDEVLYKLALAHIRQGNHYEALPYLEDVSANYPDSDFADIAHDIMTNCPSGMTVQFAVFSDPTAADVFAQNLRTRGIDARVDSITRRQKPLFAVRAGTYHGWDKVLAAVKGFHAQGLDAIVFP